MEKDWVKVYASNIAYESEIIRGMLDENGIEAVIIPRQDSSFVTMLPGMDEVYVHVSNEAQARQLIAESRPEPGKTE